MIRFRVLHRTVEIQTEAAELVEDLTRLTASLAAPASATPDVVYTVEQSGHAYTLRVERSFWPGLGRGDVFAQLETDLSRRLVEVEDRGLLHAAALARGEEVYLFAGRSGCGKTTLSVALLKRGFSFLSDEYAPLSLEDLSVEPCSMPLKLLESTLSRVPAQPEIELLSHGFSGKGETVRYGVPDPALLVRAPLRPGKLFFPWNRPELSTQALRLGPSVAVGQTMAVLLNAKRLGERAFRLATDLAQSVPAYDLVVGDIDEACRLVCALG